MNVGRLTATLSLNMKQFTDGVKDAVKQIQGVGKSIDQSMGDPGRRNIDSMSRSVQKLTTNFKDLDRIVSGILISQIFYRSVNAIEDTTRSVINFKNEMEKAKIAMEYFLGSAERAEGFIINLKDFAAVTAFSTEQALVLSRKLMGAQFRPEQIRTVMEILNDANAATGATAEQMDRIVLALTQIKTNGKLAGQEVRQLAEAGIPIYTLLQEELGLTQEQMQQGFGNLAISGEEAVMAVLNGLEKRYRGAAERIALTLPGLWETITDNLLYMSETVFDAPYRGLERFLRTWRDGLEEARDIMMQSGLGGVFERFIPESLQDSIRSIIWGFQVLGQSLREFFQALKPVASLLTSGIIKALGQVIPLLASVVRVVVRVSAAIMEANPWVRALAAAIAGLVVAGAAAKSLMFLWSVTRLGVLASVVAQAVMLLTRSIQALFLVLSRNPIVGLIMLVAGALVYLATSSKAASDWIDRVMAKLSNLAGIDLSDILQPEDGKSIEEWTSEFNESLEQMNEELRAIGTNADKASKSVKDKFVASFDELYQIPDKLDEIGSEFEDLGDLPDFPALPVTALPGLDPIPPRGRDRDFDLPGIPPVVGRPPGDGGGGESPKPPRIPPPDTSPVLAALEVIDEALQKTREALRGWSRETAPVLASWAVEAATTIANWSVGTLLTLQEWAVQGTTVLTTWSLNALAAIASWAAQAGASFLTWAGNTGQRLLEWTTSTYGALSGWAAQTGGVLLDWASGGITAVGGWAANTYGAVTGWVKDTATSLKEWASQTSGTVTGWVSARVGDITSWATETGTTINSWITGGIAGINNWALETGTVLTTWISERITDFATWASNTRNRITTWANNTRNTLSQWAGTTRTRLVSWMNDTRVGLTNWAIDTSTGIANWVIDTSTSISNWATTTATNIATWAGRTATHIADWAGNTANNLVSWINATALAIASWVVATSTNLASWVTTTSANIYGWAQNVGTNIATWATTSAQNILTWVTNTSTNLNNWVTGTAASFVSWVNATSQNIAAWANSGLSAINSWASSSWATMNSWLSGTASNIANWASSTIDNIVRWAQSAWRTIKDLASAVGEEVGGWFSATRERISNTYRAVSDWVGAHKAEIIAGAAIAGVVAAGVATVATGGAAAPALAAALVAAPVAVGSIGNLGASIPQYATGAIVDYDHIARVGEGGKREAIIPLENSTYMRPFSEAIANDLLELLSDVRGGSSAPADQRPIVYVGTLVADDRGLKELERRLEVIRVEENQRKGL